MLVRHLLEMFSSSEFYLTIDGLCDEWYRGVYLLKHDKSWKDAYIRYGACEIKSLAIISTNGMPELIIRLKELPDKSFVLPECPSDLPFSEEVPEC